MGDDLGSLILQNKFDLRRRAAFGHPVERLKPIGDKRLHDVILGKGPSEARVEGIALLRVQQKLSVEVHAVEQ